MRKKIFIILILSALGLIITVATNKIRVDSKRSLTPLMELAGKGTKTLDRLMTKIVPINDLDEKELGNIYKSRFKLHSKKNPKETKYINSIIRGLKKFTKKDFSYEGFVIDSISPNAAALPGGVILITKGLFKTLKNEAELVSVIAHELGHIELGHCFDSVRYQLLSRKLGAKTLGQFADIFYRFLIAHSFSKSQENESDNYAYNLLVKSPYSPLEMGKAFLLIRDSPYHPRRSKSSIIGDYFKTHPDLSRRIHKYKARAKKWKFFHRNQKRFIGYQNLQELRSYFSGYRLSSEWN